ncbi:MAG: hypothetical protein CMJ81_09100 [Planctomycetaceae bacterium]|nr:hypothetical protein [Planctomycetaceae bacterium]MBP62922.1 hypothetical protein [Planctomycetaceae bacterium]
MLEVSLGIAFAAGAAALELDFDTAGEAALLVAFGAAAGFDFSARAAASISATPISLAFLPGAAAVVEGVASDELVVDSPELGVTGVADGSAAPPPSKLRQDARISSIDKFFLAAIVQLLNTCQKYTQYAPTKLISANCLGSRVETSHPENRTSSATTYYSDPLVWALPPDPSAKTVVRRKPLFVAHLAVTR